MKPSELFKKEFIATIEEQLLKGSLEDTDGTVEYVDALQFLTSNRIDLVPKIYYIECREKKSGFNFAKELYCEHIKSITNGQLTEVWDSEKSGLEAYLKRFDELIDDIKENGFDEKKSVVPVGQDNGIIDGAHRTAIAIYFGLKLPIFRLNVNSWKNNYKSFMCEDRVKIPEKYMDFIAYQYMKYKSPCYMAIIWPISFNHPNYSIAIKLLNEYCNVVYSKRVLFNYNGLMQLAMHNYLDSDWAGGFEKNFCGIPGVTNERYAKSSDTTVLLLDGGSLEKIQELKKIIRIVLGEGFCRIHISDTHDEAIRMGKMLFNENSIHFLNHSYMLRYPEFISEFLKFREVVLEHKLQEDVCIDTGGVMAAYGLRKSDDIDYLSVDDFVIPGYDGHNQTYYQACGSELLIDDIVYGWFNHFYCFDIMFSAIDVVRKFKKTRAEEKDYRDIALIDAMQTDCPYEQRYQASLEKKIRFTKRVKNKLRRLLSKVYHFFKR